MQIKTIFALVAVLSSPVFAAEAKLDVNRDFKTVATPVNDCVKENTSVKFKLTFTSPAAFAPAGWGGTLYKPNCPASFSEKTGLPFVKNKDPKWSSCNVQKFCFFDKAKFNPADTTGEISVAKWPKGDYRISITVLYRGDGKDVYRAGDLEFTIE